MFLFLFYKLTCQRQILVLKRLQKIRNQRRFICFHCRDVNSPRRIQASFHFTTNNRIPVHFLFHPGRRFEIRKKSPNIDQFYTELEKRLETLERIIKSDLSWFVSVSALFLSLSLCSSSFCISVS